MSVHQSIYQLLSSKMANEKHINALRTVLDYIQTRAEVGNGIPADVVESVDVLETWINQFDN